MLAWNLKTTVGAYDKVGVKSAQWDEPARKCLTAFAHSRSAEPGSSEPWPKIISTNAAAAVDAGCTDPMVNYLFIRFAMPSITTKEDLFKSYYATAQAMNGSSYPAVRKYYATARAMDQYYRTHGTNATDEARGQIFELMNYLLADVSAAMADKTIPSEETSQISEQALHLSSGDSGNEDLVYQAIEQPLMKNRSDDYLPWYLKGNHDIDMAWSARGNGYADTVTREGWIVFQKNLALARADLEHAWKLNSKQSKIAIAMMTVVLGDGGDRKQLELWFNRAMEVDTNSYAACQKKMYFLEPKWYGSDEEELAFGRECVQSTKWGGRVPLILVLAHDYIDSRLEGDAKADYWKRPEVWADIQSAYDRFFELNPDETGYYQNYARIAYRAEQWGKLNELIPKFGKVNYEFFGGKKEFDKMVQLAKEHGSPK
jgi:hypothetical protein